MKTLKGNTIYIRALEPNDLEFIYAIENDKSIWEVSNTNTPYSRFLVKQYLENAHQDIYEAKQLRLAICQDQDFPALGLVDLFDFDPFHLRAGIGILIANTEYRQKGYATEALKLMVRYTFETLQLHQLYCNISSDNAISLQLFQNVGFEIVGTKKGWLKTANGWQDEILLQIVNPNSRLPKN